MNPENSGRSQKVVGLFLAAALTLTPGCSMNPFDWGRTDSFCTDANHDGYCDEDGRPAQGTGSRYGTWWGTGRHWGSGSSGSKTGASTGTSGSHGVSTGSKSGIGSSSRSGGGSSGG